MAINSVLKESVPTPSVVALSRAEMPADTVKLARFLLGKVLVREFDGTQPGSSTQPAGSARPVRAMGRIVETEAYLMGDPACHAFRGVTPRNRSLFLDAGHAYVYLCYGTSFLLNVSSEGPGAGAGVLLRALEPMSGMVLLPHMRPTLKQDDLGRGPGRLTSALDVDLRHDGLDLFAPAIRPPRPLWIGSDGHVLGSIGTSVRIGITKGADARLRFFVAGSDYLSGPRRLNARSN